ncbi:MAG: hypothetical protein EA425_00490 [Puniceicoccaceae bacterium]|nr:MAG: hypothetical protein EA425_00490 [Puniceicoccaceae bacterium]
MPNHPSDPTTRPTLEQLLQLKRREQPPQEFWDSFDRELRRRQLAALVRTQPWYERVFLFARFGLRKSTTAIGATCAILITLVAVDRFSSGPAGFAPADSGSTVYLHAIEVAQPEIRTARAAESAAPMVAEARYAMEVFAKVEDQNRRFTTVSSPKTLTADSGNRGTFVVNKLSSPDRRVAMIQPVFEF